MSNLLDDITLPEADKDKPAEIPKDESVVEAQPDAAAADTTTPAPPATETTTEPPAEEKKLDASAPDQTVPPVPDQAATETTPPEQKELTPFHQHPDWIKREQELKEEQARVHKLEIEVAELRGRSAATPSVPDEYAGLTAEQIADKKVRAEYDAGWKPKDQLEVTSRYNEKLAEAKNIIQQRESKELAEVGKQVETKLDELGVSDPEQRLKVKKQVSEWANEGVNVNINSFKVAQEHLRMKGELEQKEIPPVPSTPPAADQPPAPTANDAQRQQQVDANKKISRHSSTGQPAQNANKPGYSDIHKKDLDTIILEQSQSLG